MLLTEATQDQLHEIIASVPSLSTPDQLNDAASTEARKNACLACEFYGTVSNVGLCKPCNCLVDVIALLKYHRCPQRRWSN